MAVLEIPELQSQLSQDDAAIKNAAGHGDPRRARIESRRGDSQCSSTLQYDRLNGVAKSKPGLVAQQEVDDAQGKDLAARGAGGSFAVQPRIRAKPACKWPQAKRAHDQALFDYAKITAPFDGVVTQRYANFGTLMQAGTSSSTQAMPLVQALRGRSVPAGHPGARILRALHSPGRSGAGERAVSEQERFPEKWPGSRWT